ncbi:hypothetical protein ACK36H_20670, partial [Aeromonas veronii]
HARGNSGSPDDRLIFYLSTGLGEPLPSFGFWLCCALLRKVGVPDLPDLSHRFEQQRRFSLQIHLKQLSSYLKACLK